MVSDDKFIEDLKSLSVSTEKVSKYLLSELAYEDESDKINLDEIRVVYINENIENKDRLGNKLLITKESAKKFKAAAADKPHIISKSKFAETTKWSEKVNRITSEEVDARERVWSTLAINLWPK